MERLKFNPSIPFRPLSIWLTRIPAKIANMPATTIPGRVVFRRGSASGIPPVASSRSVKRVRTLWWFSFNQGAPNGRPGSGKAGSERRSLNVSNNPALAPMALVADLLIVGRAVQVDPARTFRWNGGRGTSSIILISHSGCVLCKPTEPTL